MYSFGLKTGEFFESDFSTLTYLALSLGLGDRARREADPLCHTAPELSLPPGRIPKVDPLLVYRVRFGGFSFFDPPKRSELVSRAEVPLKRVCCATDETAPE